MLGPWTFVPWPSIVSLVLACAVLAQRATVEGDSIAAYDERSTLLVRVVDENGPVARRELEVGVGRSWREDVRVFTDLQDTIPVSFLGVPGGGTRRSTDEHGILRVPVRDPDQMKDRTRPLSASDFARIELDDLNLRIWSIDSFGECTLLGALSPGELEVGELVLHPMSIVAAGRVTDSQGRPVAGARVIGRDMDTSILLRATTDAAGAFIMYDRGASAVQLQLFASTDDGLSAVRSASGGTDDLDLVVSRSFGALAGRVLLDARVPMDRVRIALQDSGWSYHVGADERIDFESGLDESGAFALPRVLPATYVLKVRADQREVASVPIGTVQSGARLELEPIDLREKLRAIRLTLASSDSASHFAGTVAMLDRKGFGASSPMPFEGSSCALLSTGSSLAVELCVQGYRTVRLADVREDWTVELEPGWPVRLVVHDELDVPRPTVSWAIALRPVGEGRFGEPIEFPPGAREVRTIVPDTGEYAVGWIRRERAGSSVYESYHPEPDYPQIEVRDVAGEQRFEFYAPVAR